jgi:hypothetical protein
MLGAERKAARQGHMSEIIDLGSLQLKFLQSKQDTSSLDMFEMMLQPNARMPIPQYHDRWDETIYALTGTSRWQMTSTRRRARPSSSDAVSCMASPIARQYLRLACASSALVCWVRIISGSWPHCCRPAHGEDERNDATPWIDPGAAPGRQQEMKEAANRANRPVSCVRIRTQRIAYCSACNSSQAQVPGSKTP